MEQIQLTKQELESLKLFSYYIQSHGCGEVTCDIYFYEDGNNVELYDLKNWYCKEGGRTSIEGYESIIEVMEKIINSIDIGSYLESDDYDIRGVIEISIDAKERKLDIELIETVRATNELGSQREVNEDDAVELLEFYELLRQEGVNEASVEFSGGGDSGEIYDNVEVLSGRKGSYKTDRNVEDFLYSWLEDFYGGWEINEGSSGRFIFNIQKNVVYLDFYENIENNESRGKVIHIDF